MYRAISTCVGLPGLLSKNLPSCAASPNRAHAHILHTVVEGPRATDGGNEALRTGGAPATNIANRESMGWCPTISAPLPAILQETRHKIVVAHRCSEDSDTCGIQTSGPRSAMSNGRTPAKCATGCRHVPPTIIDYKRSLG